MTAAYLLRRLLLTLPTILGVVLIIFVLLRVVPGDPIAMMIGSEATPEDIQRLREVYGLDKSVAEQFLIYLGGLLRGDFGTSISLKQNVLTLVLERLPATLELALVAITIALVGGIILALAVTYWSRPWLRQIIDGFNSIALAIPEFLWALLLVLAFGVLFAHLPISGRFDPVRQTDFATQFYLLESIVRLRFADVAGLLEYLILPSTALALPLMAIIARVLAVSLKETLAQDYVLLARVKGFSDARILLRHAFPNALLPTITVTGVHFIFLVGGTVLVELIFSYPGIGNMLFGAAMNRDLPLIQGVTVIFALLFITINLIIDLIYTLVNPRVRVV